MLRHIDDLKTDAIYLLKDLAPHLTKPETCRALRELAEKMTHTQSAIILTGEPIELPRDIDSMTVRFELKLPDEAERREAIRSVVESMKARQPVRVDLSREDVVRPRAGAGGTDAASDAARDCAGDPRGRTALAARHRARRPLEGRDHRARRHPGVLPARRERVRAGRLRATESVARSRAHRLHARGARR